MQVDALVKAVQDAQRGILASQYWASLCRCFEAVQAELARPELRPASESEDARGDRLCMESSHSTADSAQTHAPAGQPIDDRGSASAPLCTQGSAAASNSYVAFRAAAVHSRADCCQQPPAPPSEASVLSSHVAVDGHGSAEALCADSSSAPDERPAQALGAIMDCAEGRETAALTAWADVQQLVVFGLGSLESGAAKQPVHGS